MTDFRIIEAKPYHVGIMLRRMRAEHRAALESTGIKAHQELSRVFAASSFCRAWIIDGRLAALGGVSGMLASGIGYVWLVLSEDAMRFKLAIVKEARKQLAEIMSTHSEIIAPLLDGDNTARRFAEHLDFSISHPTPAWEKSGLIRYASLTRAPKPRRSPLAKKDGPPFIIYALPRSRTAWLSAFLSYRDWTCHHERAFFMRSPNDIKTFFSNPKTGSAETAAGPAWHLIHHYFPNIRAVVIRRPLEDSMAAMIRAGEIAGVTYDPVRLRQFTERGQRELDSISALPGTLTLSHESLVDEPVCKQLFEHCLPYEFDRDWWLSLKDKNIQMNLAEHFVYHRKNRDDIERTKHIMKIELIKLRRSGELRHG